MTDREIIARVFPRRTAATPDDPLAFLGDPPVVFPDVTAVHISCTFSWDRLEAERLSRAWAHVAPVTVGGPAFGSRGDDFEPGRYLRHGYVITSRGCPNHCWFCDVPKREGDIRELPICDGWDVLDPNLLACSSEHIDAVFSMLSRQPRRARFTGGLEAKRMTPAFALRLHALRPETVYCAYDTPDDLEPLRCAGRLLADAGFKKSSHKVRAYVLCGWKNDTFDKAERRMLEAWDAGFFPMAMAYRDDSGFVSVEWRRFQRQWANPIIIAANLRKEMI